MKFVLAALATVATAHFDSDRTYNFIQYMATHNKSYNDSFEFALRFKAWQRTDEFITKHNQDETQTHQVGHNYLSDWTHEERSKLLGLKNMPKPEYSNPKMLPKPAHGHKKLNAGRDLDWRTSGCVTDVKDQGQCGSCWSFSATGALESAYCIAGNTLTTLSEQQLVSCSWRNGNLGCNGGWYYSAWEYLKGFMSMTEDSYPYTAKSEFRECRYAESDGVTFVSSYNQITANYPLAMVDAIEHGPISVAIQADQDVYQQYTSGIITSDSCGTNIDHAVLAVGYGTDHTSGQEYWLVKNSWGTTWGDAGYVKIGIAEGDGVCGINEYPYIVYV